jgi:hypothetical protein
MEPTMADGPADVCVCVLFYGHDDYCFQLAQRVLNEPMRKLAKQNVEFRFGCNAVGDNTRRFVREQIARHFRQAVLIDSPHNFHKYPLMRRMLMAQPMTAPLTIWFDDDSCLAPENEPDKWLPRLKKQLDCCSLAGSVYKTRLVGNQADWIKAQPWYAGKEPQPYVQFVSGSWWAVRSSVLQQFDWPAQNFKHRGVDVMLGELCRQQDLAICHFRDGVWINANAEGLEAAASKRGNDEHPIGFDYPNEIDC